MSDTRWPEFEAFKQRALQDPEVRTAYEAAQNQPLNRASKALILLAVLIITALTLLALAYATRNGS